MNLFLSEILCLVVDDVEVEFWAQEISLGLNVVNVNLHAATFYHDTSQLASALAYLSIFVNVLRNLL